MEFWEGHSLQPNASSTHRYAPRNPVLAVEPVRYTIGSRQIPLQPYTCNQLAALTWHRLSIAEAFLGLPIWMDERVFP